MRWKNPARSTPASATTGASPSCLPLAVTTTLPITAPLEIGASRPGVSETEVLTAAPCPFGITSVHDCATPAATSGATPYRTLAVASVLYGVAPEVAAGVAQSWTLVIPKGQGAAVKTSVSLTPGLEAPISKGAVIGKVVVTANGKQLGEAPVVALAGVERAGFFQRMRQRVSGWFSK